MVGLIGLDPISTSYCSLAFKMEQAPATSSIVVDMENYEWGDTKWMQERGRRDPVREPMLIYEMHLGSWARVPEDGNRSLSYREMAPKSATRDMFVDGSGNLIEGEGSSTIGYRFGKRDCGIVKGRSSACSFVSQVSRDQVFPALELLRQRDLDDR